MPEIINFKNKNVILACLGLAFLYLGLHLFYLDKYPTVYADESFYNEPCFNFLKKTRFASPLYYPEPVGGFYKSNLIHGRIWNFIQVGILSTVEPTVRSIRLISFFCGLGVLFLTFLLSRELFKNTSLAFFSALLLSVSHLFVFAFHFSRPDIMVSLFILLAIYCLLKACQKKSVIFLFLSGLLAALTIDVHPSGNVAVFVLSAGALYAWGARQLSWKQLPLFALGIVCGVFWWLAWHVLPDPALWNEQYPLIQSGHRGFMSRGLWTCIQDEGWRWYSFFWQGAYHRNVWILIGLLFGLWQFLKRIQSFSFAMTLSLLLGAGIGYVWGPSKATWYIIYIYPLFCILMAGGLYLAITSNSHWQKKAAYLYCAGLCLFLALENADKLRFLHADYEQYIQKIKAVVPTHQVVHASDNYWLGLKDDYQFTPHHIISHWSTLHQNPNLNVAYYEQDYEPFFLNHRIEYIVADEELLSWPHQTQELKPVLEKHYELIHEFEDSFYGSSNYLMKRSPRPIKTKIYKKRHAI